MSQFWTSILLFTAYSFIGWLSESIFCSIPAKKFINRGFLNGPFCPIYGFGALLVISALSPFRHDLILLFFIAVILTTSLEYLTAIALETLFRTKYWDYSKHRFNFQGRICLDNSLIFGVLGVLAVDVLQPALSALVEWIHPLPRALIASVLLFYFLLDTALTVNAMYRLNSKLDELQKIVDEIKERAHTATVETMDALQSTILVRLDESTKARIRVLYDSKGKLESGIYAIQRRIIRAFPNMKSLSSNESLQRIREVLQNSAKKIRRK